MERMTQIQAEVPGPLSENEPELLAPGGVTTPAVWLLLFIFIREYGLKSSTVQIQGHHIRRRECAWWQGGVEQLLDALTSCGADLHRHTCGRTCGNDDPCA